MLKVMGKMYSDTEDNFKELVKVLEDNGYEVAYDFKTSVTIIKEVNDEFEDSTT